MKRVLIVVALMLAAAPSHAGYVWTDSAYCIKDASGAGFCIGTVRGFRRSTNAGDYTDFYVSNTGSVGFEAIYNGSYNSCWLPAGAQSVALAQFTTQGNAYFYIRWDASGTCTGAYIQAGSPFGSTY